MTTFNQWVTAFRSPALTVAGVTRYYDNPPDSLNTADLPAAWPFLFTGTNGDFMYSCSALNQAFTMTYDIVTEPVAQSNIGPNYQLIVDIADAALTALQAMTVMNFITFDMAIMTITIAGINYWGLRCNVTGQGHL